MQTFSSYLSVFLAVVGLVSTFPVREISSKEVSFDQAFQQGQLVLNRYSLLISSDVDQLVDGLLRVLFSNPIAFSRIPHRALDITLKNVENKLGRANLEILTKPMILAIEQNYQDKAKHHSTAATPVLPPKLNAETKLKIENALDEFLDENKLDSRS